jgi:curved DNA-binding protein CbpA
MCKSENIEKEMEKMCKSENVDYCKVLDPGQTYSRAEEAAAILNLTNFAFKQSPQNGKIYKIISKSFFPVGDNVYRNSSLSEASEYYLIDWLKKHDIKKILKEEGFNEKEIDYCLNYLSLPYEISQLINNKKLGLSVEETIKRWVNIEADGIKYLIDTSDLNEEEIYKVLSKFKDKIKINYKRDVKKEEMKYIKFLIENEILFYDVVNGIIKPSSIKKWYAIKEILDNR